MPMKVETRELYKAFGEHVVFDGVKLRKTIFENCTFLGVGVDVSKVIVL